jgi:hypothetical protein
MRMPAITQTYPVTGRIAALLVGLFATPAAAQSPTNPAPLGRAYQAATVLRREVVEPVRPAVPEPVYRSQVETPPAAPVQVVTPVGHKDTTDAGAVLTGTTCTTCGRGDCVPGAGDCHPCHAETRIGQFLCALYECACCPDPCYEPKWIPMADAGFFTAAARPVTHMRFRGTLGRNLGAPDRAEYFWARADGRGKGPSPPGPSRGEPSVRWNQLNVYAEAASGRIGVFTDTPYRNVRPTEVPFASGFGDLTIGTKTLLCDCELFQFSFQFATTIPVGNFRKGLGTGHLSLEPSLILGLKLAQNTFLQAQVAEWVPIGGDPQYAGAILHYHFSLNHVICRVLPDVPLIGVIEMSGLSFQDGAYTDPVAGPFQRAGDDTYFTIGPGLRMSVCDFIDFGGAAAFNVGNRLGPQQEYRIEFRFRY